MSLSLLVPPAFLSSLPPPLIFVVAEIETCSVECKANVLSLICYVFSLIHTFCVCLLALLYIVELRQAVPKSSLPGMLEIPCSTGDHTNGSSLQITHSWPTELSPKPSVFCFISELSAGTYTLNDFLVYLTFMLPKADHKITSKKSLASMLHIKLHLPCLC